MGYWELLTIGNPSANNSQKPTMCTCLINAITAAVLTMLHIVTEIWRLIYAPTWMPRTCEALLFWATAWAGKRPWYSLMKTPNGSIGWSSRTWQPRIHAASRPDLRCATYRSHRSCNVTQRNRIACFSAASRARNGRFSDEKFASRKIRRFHLATEPACVS